MDWVYLGIAGLFEIGFATFLKLSLGFSRIGYTIGFLIFAFCSFYFLSLSIRTIPIGTAYAVWTGIGAAGTVSFGMIFFDEPTGLLRFIFLSLLIGSIIGLKWISP